MAPDVITIDKIHENPHVIHKMSFFRKLKYKIYFSNYYLAKLITQFYSAERKPKAFDPEAKYIYMGIGALYVLTPHFFSHFNSLWDDVFLYGEEAVLTGQVNSVGGKIWYEPSLKCDHNESASTSKIGSKTKYKIIQNSYRFIKNIYKMMQDITGKTLLITGGTGSFGTAVLNRFLESDHFKEIRIFSRDEKKQDDMRNVYKNDKLKFYIGDVRDISSVEKAMNGVDYVFHAAALKQVPSCEFFPMEAVKTNVFGTQNVIDAAVKYEVKKVICLSTDKAAYPINAMGISKAMMEKVAVAASRNLEKTTVCLTRYGNVMASRGSVIPLFVKQIKNGEDITITDPNMTRFLMSLEEAVELVLFAFEHGNSGDLFVNKAPAGTIGDLAQALKEMFKATTSIKIIGTRHGEKLYETLCTREEMVKAQDMGDFYRIPADNRDLNYAQYFSEGEEDVSKIEDYHSHNTKQEDVEGMKQLLLKLPLIRKEILGEDAVRQYPD